MSTYLLLGPPLQASISMITRKELIFREDFSQASLRLLFTRSGKAFFSRHQPSLPVGPKVRKYRLSSRVMSNRVGQSVPSQSASQPVDQPADRMQGKERAWYFTRYVYIMHLTSRPQVRPYPCYSVHSKSKVEGLPEEVEEVAEEINRSRTRTSARQSKKKEKKKVSYMHHH